jgi:hypothetical protein
VSGLPATDVTATLYPPSLQRTTGELFSAQPKVKFSKTLSVKIAMLLQRKKKKKKKNPVLGAVFRDPKIT